MSFFCWRGSHTRRAPRSVTVPVLLLVGIVRVHFLYLNPKICKYQIFITDILSPVEKGTLCIPMVLSTIQKVYPTHRRNDMGFPFYRNLVLCSNFFRTCQKLVQKLKKLTILEHPMTHV
jgi:hypothetical protein